MKPPTLADATHRHTEIAVVALVDRAENEGRLPGPATAEWLKTRPLGEVSDYLSRMPVIDAERASFGASQSDYEAYRRAKAQGRVITHGTRA